MQRFYGTMVNKVDAKGRVSVPSLFRAVLEAEKRKYLICHLHPYRDNVLEAGGRALERQQKKLIDALPDYSTERESLALAIIGSSAQLAIDDTGRVTLPEDLRQRTGITDEVMFIGTGDKFQLWEPEAGAKYHGESRRFVQEKLRRDNARRAAADREAAP